MKILIYLAFCGFTVASNLTWASPVVLAIGEQLSVPIEPGTRYSIGNSEVIQVKSTISEPGKPVLLIKGKSQGYSDLLLLGGRDSGKKFSYRVITKSQSELFNPLGALKSDVGNGNDSVLKGQAKTLDQFNENQALAKKSNGRITNFTKIHPLLRLKAEQQIRQRLIALGLKDIEVLGVGSVIVLRGEVDSNQNKELADSIAGEVFENVRSQIKVPFEKGQRLRFKAKIIELNKASTTQLGFDWSKEMPSAIRVATDFSKALLGMDATIRLLERRGQAKVLSKPELFLNETGTAELNVGGEIPISIKSKENESVQWKPYGLKLKLEVPGASKGYARTKVIAEISNIDAANSINGIPAFKFSHLETVVDMPKGKPVLLTGLIESRQFQTIDQVPLLGSIPILGELFQSKDFRENKSELAILLEAAE